MNAELWSALRAKYPTVFSLDCWIECDDGWRDIIDRLCAVLEPKGVAATQIKEKFGLLRFYTAGADEDTWDAIDVAEAESARTCEVCGLPGELKSARGWLRTSCKEHQIR